MTQDEAASTAGRSVLLVEDEYFIASDMARSLETMGVNVLGPVASVGEALDLIADTDQIDAAILDLNLQGEMAYPVADALRGRGVPFVFATGYDRTAIPAGYADVKRCEKPVIASHVTQALFD